MHGNPGADVKVQRFTQVRQSSGQLADATSTRTDVVKILAVAVGVFEVQLVKCGAAAEDELCAQVWIGGDRADGARQEQVLLNEIRIRPRMVDVPGRDDIYWDHRSGSTSVFSTRLQRRLVRPERGPPGVR